MRLLPVLLIATAAVLAGCDQLGIESPAAVAAQREAEGKAIGAGCRHAARSVENCYDTNKKADKAAIFAGWREMNDYMRENKIEPQPAPAPTAAASDEAAADAEADEPADKAADKASAKPAKVAKAGDKH